MYSSLNVDSKKKLIKIVRNLYSNIIILESRKFYEYNEYNKSFKKTLQKFYNIIISDQTLL